MSAVSRINRENDRCSFIHLFYSTGSERCTDWNHIINLVSCITLFVVNMVISEFFNHTMVSWFDLPSHILSSFWSNWLYFAFYKLVVSFLCSALFAMTSCLHHYGISLFSVLLSLSVWVDWKMPESAQLSRLAFKVAKLLFTGQSRKHRQGLFDLTWLVKSNGNPLGYMKVSKAVVAF